MVLMLGCMTSEPADPEPAPDPLAEPSSPILLSPPDGGRVRVGTLPVFARLPSALLDASVSVTLDGVPITDPLGFTAKRWPAQGRGADYSATLELADVAPGSHTISLTFTDTNGTAHAVSGTFEWAPHPCALDISVTDGAGAPLAARVELYSAEGERIYLRWPQARKVDPMGRDTQLSGVFVEGPRRVFVPAAPTTLVATRGIRYDVATAELALSRSACREPIAVSLVLPQTTPTPGRMTADFHVHTGHSGDAFTPDLLRARSLEAADLDLAVFSDHNHVWDPAPMRPALPSTRAWVSTEVRVGARFSNLGHFNVYPLQADGAAYVPPDTDLTELFDRWRAYPAADGVDRPLIQLNHPRGLQVRPGGTTAWRAHAVFSQGGFDRAVPVGEGRNAWMTAPNPQSGTTVLDFDVLEVLNRFSWTQYREVRQDWFLLLNLGRTPTGVGNSDSHALAVELLGFPVNIVSVPPDATTADVVAAVDQGRLTVSAGPIVDLSLGGLVPGDRGTGASHEATVTVQAAPWVPAFEARLIVNGDIVHREPLPSPLPPEGVTLRWPVSLPADSWVLAEAGWPPEEVDKPGDDVLGTYAQVAPGYVPVGFTNPIWLDVDGDGAWRGLAPADAAARSAPMNPDLKQRLESAAIGPTALIDPAQPAPPGDTHSP